MWRLASLVGLVALASFPAAGATAPGPTLGFPIAAQTDLPLARAVDARERGANTRVAATYNLYASYPNLQRVRDGYFLRGTNRYIPGASGAGSDRTSLWFQPEPDGTFRQFNTTPYRECHWDLLRWNPGRQGPLVYLGTDADCYSTHSEIVFHPGIVYMPKTWTVGNRWLDQGLSNTLYSENGVPVCSGTNTWESHVLGVVRMPDGDPAVHTQTNETQTLSPIPGAPGSPSCPAGQTTSFEWQENFYVASLLAVQGADGSVAGYDAGLVRSVGGNTAVIRATGHPQWDSVFTSWERSPPADAGVVTTATMTVANASGGNTIAFTYTAPASGLKDGVITVAVPPGWTAPVTTNAIGCTTASAGMLITGGQTITVSALALPPHARVVVSYGATSGGRCAAGDGVTASATAGAPIWQVEATSTPAGAFTDLASSPSINVVAADGSGTLTTPTSNVSAGSAGNTLTFTYTAPTGGVSNGTLTITVPPGWSAPVTNDATGCTTATLGTVTTSGQTIIVAGLSLTADDSTVISYGATSGGSCSADDGTTAPASPGATTFSAEESSTAGGTPTATGLSPTVNVS